MTKKKFGNRVSWRSASAANSFPIVGRQRMDTGRQKASAREINGIRDGLGSLERTWGDQGIARLALVERDECLLLGRHQ